MGRSLLRRLRSLALSFLGTVFILIVGFVGWKEYDDRRLLGLYNQAATAASSEEPRVISIAKNHPHSAGWSEVTLQGIEGDQVIFRIAYPPATSSAQDAGSPTPPVGCVIVNYGIGQNMNFFKRLAPLFAHYNVVLVVPEQYGCGVRKQETQTIWGRFMGTRIRPARLIAETRLLIDYLAQQPQIDPTAIDYMGISYGGIIGASLLAQEPRFRSATLIMAGGDLTPMISHLLKRAFPDEDYINRAASYFGGWWLSAFEPAKYIHKAHTTRLLFQQVEPDELIPRHSRDVLVRSAREPKEERIYPGPHSPPPVSTVQEMVLEALGWMGHPKSSSTSASSH